MQSRRCLPGDLIKCEEHVGMLHERLGLYFRMQAASFEVWVTAAPASSYVLYSMDYQRARRK